MVHLLMMSTEPSRQQQQQKKQQQHQKLKLKKHKQQRKCGNSNNLGGGGVASGGAAPSRKCALSLASIGGSASSCCRGSGTCGGTTAAGGGGICLWFVLVVFMLILCGNTAISQQPQRNIKPSYNHNNNGYPNNSNNNSFGNGGNSQRSSDSILLQVSTSSANNGAAVAAGARAEHGNVALDGMADSAQKQQPNSLKSIVSTTSSTTAAKSNLSSNNASLTGIDGESGHKIRSSDSGTPANVGSNANTKTKAKINDAQAAAATAADDDDNDDLDADDDDLDNSSELLNESEDGYEHSSISPTTYRPTQRPSATPQLTAAQERERRLMHVLAARRSALHRPGFRNRIGTTGRTATAVETTSKSPTDPRSICIRNCTKNFTRRTTASCMRQCANFSRAANQSNGSGAASSGSVVMVKNSSKTGTGTAQAGEKDTNEILFTDESSHGLLVIAKEQNDTVNHINDEVKGGGVASKLRSRRKPGTTTVTVATTSIEDDEIQPYLYFGQKLPPLKPNALTITSVSDEHPKLLEVSVAEDTGPSTTPVTVSSTLSAVEQSRSRYKYNMRGGVSFNRRYTTSYRGTTPEVPTDVRTTTLRIVTNQSKVQEVRTKPEVISESPIQIVDEIPLAALSKEALREEPLATATPLIITVLSDEEMMAPTSDMPTAETTIDVSTASTSTSTTSTSTTTEKTTRTTLSSTTSTSTTTTASPSITTTTARATTTTSTQAPRKYPEYIPKKPTTTTSTTSTTTTTTSTPRTTTTTTTVIPITSTSTTTTTSTTKKPNVIEEDTELLRALGPSLTQPINTDDRTNLIIFVNHTSGVNRSSFPTSTTTVKPSPGGVTTDSAIETGSTFLTSMASTANPLAKETNSSTTQQPTREGAPSTASTTSQPQVTGEISSTVVTDDQEISLEMHRMNIVTMVLAGIGIVPLLAIILYLLRNYLLKRPIKDDEDFDVCITDQQPISPVKKLEAKYPEEDEDEVDHHKKPPQRQHSLHSKLVSAPLARDNNHNHTLSQQRYDDKSSITSDQEFERSNIRLKSLLGEGNFGQVWKAEADDLSGHFGATRIVAVKTIKACSTQLSLKDEGNIMRKLGSHQNVVTLLGACVESEPHMLIMEYAMRGRLLSLLRAARNATNILPASVPGGRSLAPLSPRTLAGFCLDIARGMEYISDKRIVHRDLAARNVLLDHNGVCKICDFGMSIDLDAERKRKEQEKNCANEIMRSNFNKFKFDFGGKFIMNHWSTGSPQKEGCSEKKSHGHDTIGKRPALPIRWMAPESLQYNIFSTETDLWAFGIVLWEIATLGSTPYSHLTGREVIRRVPQGLRPDLPKEGRHEFYNLMSRCWHKDAQMRPSFSQCRLEISRSLHKWVDDDSAASDYMDVSGFSEDLEQGMVYFNHRISEFECEI